MFTTTEFILRIAIAGVLGAAVGLERELRAKEAGTRTHFLVAMGSAFSPSFHSMASTSR